MNRKREQAELLFKLGRLFGPLLAMAENPDAYDIDERVRIMARFYGDWAGFDIKALHPYCIENEAGHVYRAQYEKITTSIYRVLDQYRKSADDWKAVFNLSEQCAADAQRGILSIPVPVDSVIHAAHTPFSTYSFLKDLCFTVSTTVIWIDRYFDQTIFHRYLADVPKKVQVTLVTWPASKAQGKADQQRVQNFRDISKLFAAERGPKGYRLIEREDFHDRWLKCDSKYFTLGASIKDLQNGCTISALPADDNTKKHFEEVIKNGTEIFGPSHTSHP